MKHGNKHKKDKEKSDQQTAAKAASGAASTKVDPSIANGEVGE